MNPADARKLLSDYAAGRLGSEQRKLLFEAALLDQDLFDELASVEEFSEILRDPGAKSRLLAVLGEPEKHARAWWRGPAFAIPAAALAVAVAASSWILLHPRKPVELAQTAIPARSEEARQAAPSPPASVEKQPAPAPSTPRAKVLDRLEPAKPAGQAASQPVQDNKIGETARAVPPVAAFRPFAAAKPARLALDYTVDGEYLIVRFATDGYFSVHFSPGSDTIVHARVAAGSQRREPIPNNATEAAIVFTALPQTTSGGVSLTSEAKSGAAEDPAGRRIDLLVRFYE